MYWKNAHPSAYATLWARGIDLEPIEGTSLPTMHVKRYTGKMYSTQEKGL